MADALGPWLREQRQARGWSADEMARRLQRAGRANADTTLPSCAILSAYVRRWERGKIIPTERYLLHYGKAFGLPPGQLGPAPAGAGPGQLTTRLNGSLPAISAAPLPRESDELPRWPPRPGGYPGDEGHTISDGHDEQPAGAVLPPDRVITAMAEESQDFGEWADTSNVGDATLEHYATQVRQLAHDYVHDPPYPVLLGSKQLRDRVFSKLQGHQRPGQTRDLYVVAAQVCGLLAWMSGDMSFYRAADSHAWTAWVCAEQANHDGARAWVRVTQSKLAYWNARYTESAQLAGDGLRYPSTDSARAMLGVFQARALARTGRRVEAAEALARARTGLEQAGTDEIGGLWGVTEARFTSLAVNTYLRLRDPTQVLIEAPRALAMFEAADPRERNYGAEAHTRIDQAHAHLLSAQLDGAQAALRPVLTLPPECRYEPVTQELGHVRQALADDPAFRDAPVARELQEEIETYCRESIVHDLGG
jgi:transcriptional regulator with XRE-family HTH domain